jgi:hypothetical protein
MVLDAKVLTRPLGWAANLDAGPPPQGAAPGGSSTQLEGERERERMLRIQALAEQVRDGSYAVHARRLALALLDWDPRRSPARHANEVDDRRREYMREYMRRRRAARVPEAEGGTAPAQL